MINLYYLIMTSCCFCNYIFSDTFEVFRSTVCPGCGKDVKVCLNCTYYKPGVYWDCRETISEPVAEKDKANFCSYFELKDSDKIAPKNDRPKQKDARDAFRKLFGD